MRNKTIHRAALTGLVALLAACGGGGSDKGTAPVALADFSGALVDAFCSKTVTCCTGANQVFTSADVCVRTSGGYVSGMLITPMTTESTAGRVVYSAQEAGNCLAAFNGMSCEQLNAAGNPIQFFGQTCGGVFAPQLVADAICESDVDCIGGYCDGTSNNGSLDGHCKTFATAGADCSATECAAGFLCAAGVPPTCQALKADGAPCATDGECQSDNCAGTAGAKTCTALPAGAFCGFF